MNESTHNLDRSGADRDAPLPLPASFGQRMLFALSGGERPTSSLKRSREIARQLSTDLHVVQVLAELPSMSSGFPQARAAQALASLEDNLAAIHATPRWLGHVLGGDLSQDKFAVYTGAFVEKVVDHAALVDASLIVLAERKRRFGTMVTMLSRASGLPVLVLRDASSEPSILAATDLEDARLPVLRRAADFGERFHVRVVAFHNLTPSSSTPSAPIPNGLESVLRKLRLSWASRELHLAGETIASESSPADAIVRTAHANNVDLVVVGARAVSRLGRFSLNNIAVDVVDRARSSVLVIPLERAVAPGTDANRDCA
ncbi:MAG TPA: universal stress protein [Polyangiales bacterium]